MANDIRSRLYFEGIDIQDVKQRYATKRYCTTGEVIEDFDFNKVIPEPPYEGSIPDIYWRTENWGTKRNGMFTEWGDQFVEFETAWDPPMKVVKKLAELNGCRIVIVYYDTCTEWATLEIVSPMGTETIGRGKIRYQLALAEKILDEAMYEA